MFYNAPIDMDVEDWEAILDDPDIAKQPIMDILTVMFQSDNYEARASEIASQLRFSHHIAVISIVVRFSKRVTRALNVGPPMNKNGEPQWWHLPFLGYEGHTSGQYPWILREELAEALGRKQRTTTTDVILPDEMRVDPVESYLEGSTKLVRGNAYERNIKAREACLKQYGYQCVICGFDFEKVYGPLGKGKIHVHHLTPLAKISKEYEVDPIRDLRPICPNCHLMVHSKTEPFTIDELKAIIQAVSSQCNRT